MACKVALAVVFLLGLSTLASGHLQHLFNDDIMDCAEDIEKCFEHWMSHYKHVYSLEEKQHRFKIFTKNILHVSERMKGEVLCHFRLGLNAFAALSKEEFDSTRLGGLSKVFAKKSGFLDPYDTQSNYSSFPSPAPPGGQRRLLDFDEHQRMLAALPTAVDWRTKGVVNRIRDQYPCAGCYAFATVATVESFVAIKTGRLLHLSEKDIINCCFSCPCCGTACSGGYIESAFEFAKTTGLVPETLLPYREPIERTCPIAPTETRKTKIDNYQVKHYPQLTEMDIMTLVSQHPVTVYFYADTEFETRWYKGGVYTGPCRNRPQTGNHFMTIVGYGYDTVARKNYWLVRNSWGESWGENGYIKILRGPGATGDGVCGIQYLAAWPLQVTTPRPRPRGMRGMKGKKKGRAGHRAKKGGRAVVRSPPPPSPSPAPVPPSPAPAPVSLALAQCDFFFTASSPPEAAPIPVIALKESGDNVYEPPIAAYNRRTKSAVQLSSANSNLDCADYGVRKPGAPPLPNCHFVFQFTGNQLSTKSFNNPAAFKAFTSQAFIKIPITGAQLEGSINLNKGDGNADFPESRRCVVFVPAAA